MTQEALKLALEKIATVNAMDYEYQAWAREALAQPEQEPVADDFFRMIADRNPKPFPLPQRTWVGLEKNDMPDGEDPMFDHKYFYAGMVFAAKVLKEKNT